MKVEIDIQITRNGETFDISKTVDENETIPLEADGESDWRMRITPVEIMQEATEPEPGSVCPVCGDQTNSTDLSDISGESIEPEKICVEETDELTLYIH